MRLIDVAAAVIFNDRGQLLIAQRSEPEAARGLWEFPGGKIDPGESTEEALHREIQEELEMKIEIDFLIGEFVHDYENHTVRILAFACKALSEKFEIREHLDVRWIEPSDLKDYQLTGADLEIFPTFLRMSGKSK